MVLRSSIVAGLITTSITAIIATGRSMHEQEGRAFLL
jgi:hypothetical protein